MPMRGVTSLDASQLYLTRGCSASEKVNVVHPNVRKGRAKVVLCRLEDPH